MGSTFTKIHNAMTAEEALALIDALLGGRLKDIQTLVVRYSWNGWTYPQIAEHAGYDTGHIRDIGSELGSARPIGHSAPAHPERPGWGRQDTPCPRRSGRVRPLLRVDRPRTAEDCFCRQPLQFVASLHKTGREPSLQFRVGPQTL
jgi:hypothetical protein